MKAFRLRGTLDDDSLAIATIWEHGCRGVIQEDGDLVAYFDGVVDLPVAGAWEAVDEVDYLERYFAGLQPVDLGPIVVAPTHASVSLDAGQKPLWLDPGMAFGTGHHETTRLMLRALGRLELAGARLLDVGAGSGILAIAGDLLGAAEATGIDNDPATIPVARANAALNRSRARFELGVLADVLDAAAHGVWDVLVANLFAELHAQLLPEYVRATGPGASILLSGISEDKLELVLEAIPAGAAVTRRETDGAWVLLELHRR